MTLKVTIHMNPPMAHHQLWGEAFADGLRIHGIESQIIGGYLPTECDLAVFWGHHDRALPVMDAQWQVGKRYLMMERGKFGDRYKMTCLGYDGNAGRADFLNANSPSDRWEKHGVPIDRWKRGGGVVLIMGQLHADSSVKYVNIVSWYRDTVKELRSLGVKNVLLRRHPLDASEKIDVGCEYSDIEDLDRDLSRTRIVVTFNSTSGVNAIIAGVPVIALDKASMVWSVAAHELKAVKRPIRPDRQQWLDDLAYCQWTEAEIRSGEAWEHLKKGLR